MANLGSNLLRYGDRKILCFDLETEGLALLRHRPWQVSWNISQNGKILKEHDYYVWMEDLDITDGAKKATNFNYGQYEEMARPVEEVWKLFAKDFLNEDYVLIGHNVIHYDSFIYSNLRKMMGLPVDWTFMNRLVDTLALSRAYRTNSAGMEYNKGIEFLAWQYRMLNQRAKKCKLSDMADEFEIQYNPDMLHNARYDNELCVKVFNQLIWKVEV